MSIFGQTCQTLIVTDHGKGRVPSASNLRIICLNANSIGKLPKRNRVFNFLNKQSPDILIVCDTRIAKNIENSVKEEWGGPAYFSSFDAQSRGVAIFIRKNLPIKVLDKCSDNLGNLLAVLFEYDSKIILLQGVYGPNADNPIFYENEVFKKLKNGIHIIQFLLVIGT